MAHLRITSSSNATTPYLLILELEGSLAGFALTVGLRSRPEERGFCGEGCSLKALLSEELERVDIIGPDNSLFKRRRCRDSAEATS